MNPALFFGNTTISEALAPLLKEETFPKGSILQQSGEVSKKIYFIESGLIRVYYHAQGKEMCCHFAKEGDVTTGIDSFFTGKPSIYTSEAIESTYCFSLSKDQLEWAFKNIAGMDRFGRTLITDAYIDLVERFNSQVILTAHERYELFLSTSPELLNRLPLGHIASYLGMSQETLSRIRGKR